MQLRQKQWSSKHRYMLVADWLNGCTLVTINKCALGPTCTWMVTESGANSQCQKFISVCNQSSRLTQPGKAKWIPATYAAELPYTHA